MWTLLAALIASAALADEGRAPTIGEVVLPITPSEEGVTEYVALFDMSEADGTWTSDQPGFECVGVGDYVQIVTRVDIWPSALPKKVICREQGGKRKVKAKVKIDSDVTHRAMIVSDGTLVMPREHKASVIYRGEVPHPDLIVQQGKTGSLSIHCRVLQGPVLEVIVDPESKDGDGQCSLRTRDGEFVRLPIRIVTAKYR